MEGCWKFPRLDLLDLFVLILLRRHVDWTRLGAWRAGHSLLRHRLISRHVEPVIDAQKERREVIGQGKDVSCNMRRGKSQVGETK